MFLILVMIAAAWATHPDNGITLENPGTAMFLSIA